MTAPPPLRPAVAGADTDVESADAGPGSSEQALRALKVLLDRKLISQEDFQRRAAAIKDAGGR